MNNMNAFLAACVACFNAQNNRRWLMMETISEVVRTLRCVAKAQPFSKQLLPPLCFVIHLDRFETYQLVCLQCKGTWAVLPTKESRDETKVGINYSPELLLLQTKGVHSRLSYFCPGLIKQEM